MDERNSNDYEDLLGTLYPGYSKMSDKKKELIQMKSFDIIRFSKEIKALLPEMQNPDSPLWQQGAENKDLIKIAYIYSSIYENSKNENVNTGRVVKDGPLNDSPRDEYITVQTDDKKREQLMKQAVERYNSSSSIKPTHVISFLKNRNNPEISFEAAMQAKGVLDSLKSRGLEGNNLENEGERI